MTVNGKDVPGDRAGAPGAAAVTPPASPSTRRRSPPATRGRPTREVKVDGFFAALGNAQALRLIGILTIMVLYVTAVYGPIAAALVEFFPTRIRYTAMSLPYHIGNGWFGGLLPATSFAIVASTGDIYAGLWYPIVFALMTVVIGLLFVRRRRTATSSPTRASRRALSAGPLPRRTRSPAERSAGLLAVRERRVSGRW